MLYPFVFELNLFEIVWGGNRLKPLKGLPADTQPIGESWEVSAVPGKESIIANGPLAGMPLTRLVETYGAEVLGKSVAQRYGNQFPLLIKFIDAASDLSIQVHPDDALAGERHGCMGKTEMWFVMDARPGAFLYSGMNQPISKYEYRKRVEDGSICEVLQKHNVSEGDVFFIPAGRVHAIGGGTLIAEIQQSSDVTYRIYDYGRLGLDGNPRQLHTELACDAIDYNVYDSYMTNYTQRENKPVMVTECPYFTVKKHNLTRSFHRKLLKYDSFIIYMCLHGTCCIRMRNSYDMPVTEVKLRAGNSCLIPASIADMDIIPDNLSGKTQVLEVYIPKN